MGKKHSIATTNKLAMEAANQGFMNQAISRLHSALRLAQSEKSPLMAAVTLNNLGIAKRMHGKRDEAGMHFRTAQLLALAARGEDHPLVRIAAKNLSALQQDTAHAA